MTITAYRDDTGKVTVIDDSLPTEAWKARRTVISLANFTGDADSIAESATRKWAAESGADITASHQAATVAALTGLDLDDLGDGTTYKRVNTADLTSNRVDIDKIGDGTTYKKFLATEQTKLTGIEALADVTSTHQAATVAALTGLDLDDLADGTNYKRVAAADIKTGAHVQYVENASASIKVDSTNIRLIGTAPSLNFYYDVDNGTLSLFSVGTSQAYIKGIGSLDIYSYASYVNYYDANEVSPVSSGTGTVGLSDNYFNYIYGDDIYYKTHGSFQTHDDITLIRQMQEDPNKPGITKKETIPQELKRSIPDCQVEARENALKTKLRHFKAIDRDPDINDKKKEKQKIEDVYQSRLLEIDSMGEDDVANISMGKAMGLSMGAIRQIADRLDAIDKRIEALERT